jgi:hypothetical protein
MAFISQRQFTVTISGITGVFMTKSGGGISSDATKIYSGGNDTPSIITGVPEIENITVGRAYDSGRDDAMLESLRSQVGRLTATITVQETNANYNAGTLKKAVYAGAVLVGITEPDYDSSSGDAAMVELEFACKSVATS